MKDTVKGRVDVPVLKTIPWPLFSYLEIEKEARGREISEVPINIEGTLCQYPSIIGIGVNARLSNVYEGLGH